MKDIEEKYKKLVKVDQDLADEFLLNSVKAKILSNVLNGTSLYQKVITEKPPVEEVKAPVVKDSTPSDRPEVIAQLEDLGVEYKSSDSTKTLRNRLRRNLITMGLHTKFAKKPETKIEPAKAECKNTVITKTPENKGNKDIINDIMKSCKEEEDEAYNLSFTENGENSDW